ncbi:hypothetical protein L3Q82_009331 [Scortum barcoo]|uniref:Uncharacterized protein n=1 Tax=Scortum barcoo TaxID=214431 RepID=A0ACB8WFS4_9TELE|nr:hypothetical protein L3Q82_009331 [Scortum barcoo]
MVTMPRPLMDNKRVYYLLPYGPADVPLGAHTSSEHIPEKKSPFFYSLLPSSRPLGAGSCVTPIAGQYWGVCLRVLPKRGIETPSERRGRLGG